MLLTHTHTQTLDVKVAAIAPISCTKIYISPPPTPKPFCGWIKTRDVLNTVKQSEINDICHTVKLLSLQSLVPKLPLQLDKAFFGLTGWLLPGWYEVNYGVVLWRYCWLLRPLHVVLMSLIPDGKAWHACDWLPASLLVLLAWQMLLIRIQTNIII